MDEHELGDAMRRRKRLRYALAPSHRIIKRERIAHLISRAIRAIASSTLSLASNALSRMYPSPEAPNPLPGVHTTCAFLKSVSKKSQLETPSGVLTHAYGALTPPYTFMPIAPSFSR